MPHPEMLQENYDHLLIWANNTQYVATCRNSVATDAQHVAPTMSRYAALTCCDCLVQLLSLKSALRPTTTLIKTMLSTSKQGVDIYNF